MRIGVSFSIPIEEILEHIALKELFTADQALEDSANIITGYVGFLEQKEQHGTTLAEQQPDPTPSPEVEPPEEVENEE